MSRRSAPPERDCRSRPAAEKPFELEPEPPPRPPRKTYQREPKSTPRLEAMSKYWDRHQPPATHEETWFRHTHWANKRKLVREALVAAGTGERQLETFDACGAQCLVEFCPAENKYRLRADYCKCRHCEPCARAKANLLSANLRKRLELTPNGRYRFITLTLKHVDVPLADQIKRLNTSWRKLRATKGWKASQRGGCAIIEVKWDPKTRHWHPHMHCVCEGDFLDKKRLSELWHGITGDSFVVDIRALDSSKDAAHYVAKYVSKGTNGEVWHDAEARVEWVCAMKGVRTAATYGTWRGFKLLGHDTDERHWVPVGLLYAIVGAARDREEWAVGCLKSLMDDLQYNPHKPRGKKHEPGNDDDT